MDVYTYLRFPPLANLFDSSFLLSSDLRLAVKISTNVRLPAVEGNAVLVLPQGSITYYENGNYMVAECDEHSSQRPKCKRTRTCAAAKHGGGPQGRPLGFLAGFLMCCEGHPNAKAHYEAAARLTHEQRRKARHHLRLAPGSAFFFERERSPRDGESSEPDACV